MESSGAAEHDVWRLFVAVELAGDVRRQVEIVGRRLAQGGWRARWTRPDAVHLTLKFYGEVSTGRLDTLQGALEQAVEGHPRFQLTTAQPGAFPNLRRPRVIWLGVAGDVARLERLAAEVDRQSAAAGFPAEERAFRPHITVGRMRPEDQTGNAGLERHLAGLADLPRLAIPVEHIALIRSQLRREGALYTTVRSFPLQG